MDAHNWQSWSDGQDPDTGDLGDDSAQHDLAGHNPGDPFGHDGPMAGDSLGHHNLGHDGLGHDGLGHDGLDHDNMANDHLGHDPLGHDPLGPDGDDPFDAPHGHQVSHSDTDLPPDEPGDFGHHGHQAELDEPLPTSDQVHHVDLTPVETPDTDDGRHHDLFVLGTDPDTTATDDGAWHESLFPPQLHLAEPPEPVDGFPWSDPTTLGHHDQLTADHPGSPDAQANWSAPTATELADFAGTEVADGAQGWQQLLESDDPAVSALARWWAPN